VCARLPWAAPDPICWTSNRWCYTASPPYAAAEISDMRSGSPRGLHSGAKTSQGQRPSVRDAFAAVPTAAACAEDIDFDCLLLLDNETLKEQIPKAGPRLKFLNRLKSFSLESVTVPNKEKDLQPVASTSHSHHYHSYEVRESDEWMAVALNMKYVNSKYDL
ncbi:28S ribosomal protein S27, mitochondrial, partial [Frankliniella fusca]